MTNADETRSEYLDAVVAWEERAIDHWLELRDALSARRGWKFDAGGESGAPAWCFGEYDECRLAVTANPRLVVLVECESGKEHHLILVDWLVEWLDQHESEFLGTTQIFDELVKYLGTPENLERLVYGTDGHESDG